MKLILLLTTAACLQASAIGYSQTISLSFKNTSLEKVFIEIQKQSGYHFIYTKEELQNTKPVSIDVKNVTVSYALDICFKGQPITYTLQEPYIIIKRKEENKTNTVTREIVLTAISGSIVNEEGEAVAGATIAIKGSSIATASNDKGEWKLEYEGSYTTIIVSSIGYETKEAGINGKVFFNITMQRVINSLDEMIVIAYGNTTKRLSTGNVSKVTAAEINKQPVSNPLAALHGRVPGLVVTQSSGLPGGSIRIQLRGRTALDVSLTDDQPLFVIDGIPFAPNNGFLNSISSALGIPSNAPGLTSPGGLSPFNSINPDDIESIEILKDADATAIYGSRGANGVIIITTKKGKPGNTVYNFSVQYGQGKVTRTMKQLNTTEYMAVRREAFRNDGVSPTISNAYDMLVWDSTRNTNLAELLTGGTAITTDVRGSVSGGNSSTNFLLGGSYHRESTVFPGDLHDERATVHFSGSNSSMNKKFSILLTANYSTGENNLNSTDLSSFLHYPSNFKIYDSTGNLSWNEGGITGYNNPLAYLLQKYAARTDNLISNIHINYKLGDHIQFRLNTGYNHVLLNEVTTTPAVSQNPNQSQTRSAVFGSNYFKSWIVEPQIHVQKNISKGKLEGLAGATWQDQTNDAATTTGLGYSSDELLFSLNGATTITGTRGYSKYRYTALFGRLNYNWQNKYIVSLTGRRDGSSRFGPDQRFANFSSAATAWIFSNEQFIIKHMKFVSFGKVKFSYGKTGNDNIINYQYLDTWTSTTNPYQGSGLTPTKLYNPDYHWEKTTKLEASLDLGFLKDRLLVSSTFYRNRSSDQLVQYKMPYTTGFTSIVKNLPALVQNKGIEITTSSINIKRNSFEWSSTFNISIPQTRLVSFPGLSNSTYSNTYVEGEPLNVILRYILTGVDAATGLYKFEDINKDSILNTKDYRPSGHTDPKYFGGLGNRFRYKGLELEVFLQFVHQTGRNYAGNMFFAPGTIHNVPRIVLDRWQNPGDQSTIQRFTQQTSGQGAATAFNNFRSSSDIYSDASFIRLKNISVSYNIPEKWLDRANLTHCRIYINCQNLFAISRYKGGDPETQNYLRLPPLRNIAGGIQITF